MPREDLPMNTKYLKGRLYKMKIAELQPDPEQARKFMDPIALKELAASISQHGVLTPIQFRQNAEGAPVIVSGHRRVRAAGMAGRTEIPATFTAGDTRLQGFVENIQREGLLPIEEAEEMDRLMGSYNLNQTQLAEAIGKDQPHVSRALTLNRLPEDIRNACRTNPSFSKATLLDFARMKTETAMRRKFDNYMKKAAAEGQTAALKPRLTPARALIKSTDELTGKLDGLPWRDWSEDDRNDLVGALAGIRTKAGELLADMGYTPEEEEVPSASKNLS